MDIENKIDAALSDPVLVNCLLDKETFTCCKCGNNFGSTEGTWLPIAINESRFMQKLSNEDNEPPMVFAWDLRPPEIITSEDFTCYDCID